jgi:hypothetical protein
MTVLELAPRRLAPRDQADPEAPRSRSLDDAADVRDRATDVGKARYSGAPEAGNASSARQHPPTESNASMTSQTLGLSWRD